MKQRISKHRHFVIHYSTIKLEKWTSIHVYEIHKVAFINKIPHFYKIISYWGTSHTRRRLSCLCIFYCDSSIVVYYVSS